MRAWSGPHKVAQVLQEGRVYILDSGQKEHFERLKPHHSGSTEWVTVPTNNGDVAVIMDPEPEQSLDGIPDDFSQSSYSEEEPLSEASNSSMPLEEDTGWILECGHEGVLEAAVSIINNLILRLTLMANYEIVSSPVRKWDERWNGFSRPT